MAALSEARRLTGMVLANNGTFGLWQRAQAAGNAALAGQYETELWGDTVFQAYQQLGLALAEAQPTGVERVPGEGGAHVRLAERIALLPVGRRVEPVPCAACADGVTAAVVCCGDRGGAAETVQALDVRAMGAEVSLGARLNRVLELTAMTETEVAVPVWAAQHDEARVSIVYKDVPPAVVAAGEAKRPRLVSLFR